MKKAGFVAVCPFEIGDVIMCGSQAVEITDIMALHSLKTGKVTVRYEFNGSGVYQPFSGTFTRRGNVFTPV